MNFVLNRWKITLFEFIVDIEVYEETLYIILYVIRLTENIFLY